MDIGGATLAAAAMRAGLIDEYVIVTHPVLVGGGTPFFTGLDDRVKLSLVETRTFPDGVLLTRYETRRRVPVGSARASGHPVRRPAARSGEPARLARSACRRGSRHADAGRSEPKGARATGHAEPRPAQRCRRSRRWSAPRAPSPRR